MKTFYIIDENGEFYSEDRKVRYKALSGNALHVFLASDQGKEKFFSTDTDSNGNVIGIEIPDNYRAEYEKERLHSKYLREIRSDYITISLNIESGEDGTETLESFLPDEESDEFFDIISKREQIHLLKNILPSLDKEEMELIFHLFLSDEPMTEVEYAEKIECSRQVVAYQKRLILDRLKKILK